MRTLVLIAADHYVRQFIDSGALAELDDGELHLVASAGRVVHPATRARLAAHPGYVGAVEDPRPRAERGFAYLRRMLLSALRHRSRTLRHKERQLPPLTRWRFRIAALPGLRRAHLWRVLRRAGTHPQLERIVAELRPELIVAPTGGHDTLVWEGLLVARRHGIPSLCLIHNWDNLSSKGAFAVKPDHLAVWGEQSVEHAVRIHGFERRRVHALGAPSLDPFLHHERGATASPFPFRYVLFAGCYAPFDERGALEALDAAIARAGLDVTVVYRPHPHRAPRARPDRIDEAALRHVVIDPEVRDAYLTTFGAEYGRGATRLKPLFPALDSYPARLEHAELVICPLSTMMVEAAIFERRVVVVAYDDGVHATSPSTTIDYEHFEGVERVEGFTVVRRREDLGPALAALLAHPDPDRPMREQLRWWLHFDERTYAERLADLVDGLAGRRAAGTTLQGRS
jgi:hypothetical protein